MNQQKYTIATIASHSALQILKGAKDEGFATLAVVQKENEEFYRQYRFIDKYLTVVSFKELLTLEKKIPERTIFVPHGSFVAYLGADFDGKTTLKYFGNKKILAIEADRQKQNLWFKKANIPAPKIFKTIGAVDRPVIVKAYGARGGSGYRLCFDKKELKEALSSFKGDKFLIQEYLVGTPVYIQYFYSSLENRLEITGIDRRYESTADAIGRIPASDQAKIKIKPSFTVIGNFPIVLRESLLPKVYALGQNIIKASQKIAAPLGLFGPFCLECIIDEKMSIRTIEISCRIVAGTNLYIDGSPYSDLLYGKKVSSGRRIAMEIKKAVLKKKLADILT